jgi:methionyl-tRNA formyltransferase
MNIVFFGSTTDSVIVLDALATDKDVSRSIGAVVTQPAKPVGRKQILTPTPVEMWAETHHVPCLTFPTVNDKPWHYAEPDRVNASISPFSPDLLVSASYGQKIPEEVVRSARFGGVNVHPSLLPRWRGTDPIPWTILAGDAQTGVTIVTLSKRFDEGKILAQQKIPMPQDKTPDEVRVQLFTLGSTLLTQTLPDYWSGKRMGQPQNPKNATYARRLMRDDGFVPWDMIRNAEQGIAVQPVNQPGILPFAEASLPEAIVRAIRALSPWPGVWTMVNTANDTDRRLKILSAHVKNEILVIETVQLEGKSPTRYAQFSAAYELSS